MPNFTVLLALTGFSSALILLACDRAPPTPDAKATYAATFWRNETVVAGAVRSIQATSTAKENRVQCLRHPLSCQSLGLHYNSVRKGCIATVEAGRSGNYSPCMSQLLLDPPTPIPVIQPQRPSWAPPRPSVPTVSVPRP